MEKFVSQKDYISQNQKLDDTPDRVKNLKKEYRALYMREYRQRNKKRKSEKVKLSIRLEKDEHARLKYSAVEHNKSLSQFIIASSLAYLEKGYVIRNKEQFDNLIASINRTSSNINQVVHRIHQIIKLNSYNGEVDVDLKTYHNGYKLLKDQVLMLRKKLSAHFSSPPLQVVGLSWEEVSHDSKKIQELVDYLIDHKKRL